MVEQRTENPRVGGSTPPLGISAESFFADILHLSQLRVQKLIQTAHRGSDSAILAGTPTPLAEGC